MFYFPFPFGSFFMSSNQLFPSVSVLFSLIINTSLDRCVFSGMSGLSGVPAVQTKKRKAKNGKKNKKSHGLKARAVAARAF